MIVLLTENMKLGLLAAAMMMSAEAPDVAHGQGGRNLTVEVDVAGVAHIGSVSEAAPGSVATEPARSASELQTAGLAAKMDRGVTPGTGSDSGRGPCRWSALPSPTEAEALVRRVAQEEDFYPDFVLSVARIESRFRADQVSPKGAVGLMQLMPATAARFTVDICDPADNVRGGIRYLRFLHDRYRNPFYVLAAYNAGEEALAQYRGVPPFPETVRYVADVINDFYTLPSPGAGAFSAAIKQPSARRPMAAPQSEAGWSQGFVMHVEN